VDVLIGRVRRKVDAGSGVRLLQTVRGIGYVLSDREMGDAS
jgi:DNA-binding response OmpR family regulator